MNEYRDEVLEIAGGLGPEEILRRAVQAADWADEARGRYTSILDTQKRGGAALRAIAWESIADYMKDSGAAVFSRDEYEEWVQPGPILRRVEWLIYVNPFAWAEAFREIYGTRPRKRNL